MYRHLIQKLSILAGMAVIASLGSARSALADLTVTATETGGTGTVTLFTVSGNASGGLSNSGVTMTVNDFTITAQGASAGQVSNISEELASTTSIQNNTGAAHILTIVVTASGYNNPLSGAVDSHIGGTAPIGSTTLSLTSTVDGAAPISSGNLTAPPSFQNDAFGSVSGLPNPYTITETIVFNVSANGQVNYSSSTTITSTPEPATVAMALTALPLLGLGALIRRRARA
jgi:hypothetical protein